MATLFNETINFGALNSGNRWVLRPKETCELNMMADPYMQDSSKWTPTAFTYNSALKRWEWDAGAEAIGLLEQPVASFNKSFRSTTRYMATWNVQTAASGIVVFQITNTLTGAAIDLTTDDLGANGYDVGTHTKTFNVGTLVSGAFQLLITDTAGSGIFSVSYFNIQEIPIREDNTNVRPEEWFKIPVAGARSLAVTWGSYVRSFVDNSSTYSAANRIQMAAFGAVSEDDGILSVPQFMRSDFAYTSDSNDSRHYRLNIYRNTLSSVLPYVLPAGAAALGSQVSIVGQDLMQRSSAVDPVAGEYNSGFCLIGKKEHNNDDWASSTTQQPIIPSIAGLRYVYLYIGLTNPSMPAGNWTRISWDLKIATGVD